MNEQKPSGFMVFLATLLYLFRALEASVIQVLRYDMGMRYNDLRTIFLGWIAGFVCIAAQEVDGRPIFRLPDEVRTELVSDPYSGQFYSVSVGPRYQGGFAAQWLVVYPVFGFAQWLGQWKNFNKGKAVHSYGTGIPMLSKLFPRTDFDVLRGREVALLLALAFVCEVARLPLSLWLLLAAAGLIVRDCIDTHVGFIHELDANDAHADAADLARIHRGRRSV
jgi:hypothetical protein